jgi:hypothetical protein
VISESIDENIDIYGALAGSKERLGKPTRRI